MTIDNFKAWLRGYGEGIDGAPTPEQWHRIKSELGQVQEAEPVRLSPYQTWPLGYTINTPTFTYPPPPVRIVPITVGDPLDTTPTITCLAARAS